MNGGRLIGQKVYILIGKEKICTYHQFHKEKGM